ncbi:MAG: 8-amino-7-oxononanoate synthase, partial [Dokdonia sp.]
QKKIATREANGFLRELQSPEKLIDFSSNDYLGFSKNGLFLEKASQILQENNIRSQGATGSRLLSGNHIVYPIVENAIAGFHESETALIFNSGYDANIGFFQCVPQRGDVILYDEFIHASIRDGITMSHAKAFKFSHNNLDDLEKKLIARTEKRTPQDEIYVVTESVFSMDGDSPDLSAIQTLCETYNAHFIVDEAHATGVIGTHGQGLVQMLGLEKRVFARIVTFGKAMGTHGAAILCSKELRGYLINFARSLIYTTALPPHTLATILASYNHLISDVAEKPHPAVGELQENIKTFTQYLDTFEIRQYFIPSRSAIQCVIIPGRDKVIALSRKLKQHGYNVKPILSPTVPEGKERLRFCLHSFTTQEEIIDVLSILKDMIPKFTP